MAFKEKKILKNISSKAWEHPADKAALSALKQVPGLNELLQKVLGFISDKSLRLSALASAVRVTPTQYAEVYRLHKEACMILDAPYLPELYIAYQPVLGAGARGVEKPHIILNSGLVENCSLPEIQFVIGHEIGHCLSGHALYKTMLDLLLLVTNLVLIGVPVAQLALGVVATALREWYRKSELSADRVGLLTVQEPEIAYTMHMKMAGGANVSKMDINEFFKQAADYDRDGDVADGFYKFVNVINETHPFPVMRLTELKTWVDSGDFQKILNGDYLKRENAREDVGRTFKEAADQYKEDINKSEDPLNNIVNDFLDNINDSAKKVSQFFEDFFKDKQ